MRAREETSAIMSEAQETVTNKIAEESTMTDYREILRLDSLKHSQRSIAQAAGCSRNTVEKVLRTARDKGVQWPVEDDIGNRELEEILFPGKYKNG